MNAWQKIRHSFHILGNSIWVVWLLQSVWISLWFLFLLSAGTQSLSLVIFFFDVCAESWLCFRFLDIGFFVPLLAMLLVWIMTHWYLLSCVEGSFFRTLMHARISICFTWLMMWSCLRSRTKVCFAFFTLVWFFRLFLFFLRARVNQMDFILSLPLIVIFYIDVVPFPSFHPSCSLLWLSFSTDYWLLICSISWIVWLIKDPPYSMHVFCHDAK